MLYFWSRDGVQIFSIDLLFDLVIGRHYIILFPGNPLKLDWQNCKFGRGEFVNFPSLVGLSLWLIDLFVVPLRLFLIVSCLGVSKNIPIPSQVGI